MRLKRVVATLVMLPLLHLNVARAAIGCDRHEDDATGSAAASSHELHATAATPATDAHGMHTSRGSGTAAPSEQERPAGNAASTECCQSLASCSLALGFANGQALASPDLADEARPAAATNAPTSRIRSPEPPPPRA